MGVTAALGYGLAKSPKSVLEGLFPVPSLISNALKPGKPIAPTPFGVPQDSSLLGGTSSNSKSLLGS